MILEKCDEAKQDNADNGVHWELIKKEEPHRPRCTLSGFHHHTIFPKAHEFTEELSQHGQVLGEQLGATLNDPYRIGARHESFVDSRD